MRKSHIAADQYGPETGVSRKTTINNVNIWKHASLKANAACTINDLRWFHIESGSFRRFLVPRSRHPVWVIVKVQACKPKCPWLSHSSAALHSRSQTFHHSDCWYFARNKNLTMFCLHCSRSWDIELKSLFESAWLDFVVLMVILRCCLQNSQVHEQSWCIEEVDAIMKAAFYWSWSFSF